MEESQYYMEARRAPVKTEKAVEYFLYSLYIMLIFGILNSISGIIALYGMGGGYNYTAMGNNTHPGMGLMGFGALMLTLGCAVTILMILYVVLLIMGILSFRSGKNEFGGKHSSSVSKGVFSFVLVILSIVAGILITAIMMSSLIMASLNNDEERLWSLMRGYAILLSLVFSLLLNTFLGLTYTFMVKEIAPEDKRKFLYAGLFMFILAGLVAFLVTSFMLPQHMPADMSDMGSASSNARNISNIGSLLSIIGVVLFIIPYKALLDGIKSLKILPQQEDGEGQKENPPVY